MDAKILLILVVIFGFTSAYQPKLNSAFNTVSEQFVESFNKIRRSLSSEDQKHLGKLIESFQDSYSNLNDLLLKWNDRVIGNTDPQIKKTYESLKKDTSHVYNKAIESLYDFNKQFEERAGPSYQSGIQSVADTIVKYIKQAESNIIDSNILKRKN
ncbi:uncharacterized protein LOC126894341 [Daktulosphaira vitifoliae]|uniref:uncharacterized protein LOC126894341 n=1 Tax=Daktulosphaira vitifoliae TaxID=58002 RepID=UPI0021A9EE45|nr:uncharacterized protein LOC126894341 [Daktulosphaira vitifoliae]